MIVKKNKNILKENNPNLLNSKLEKLNQSPKTTIDVQTNITFENLQKLSKDSLVQKIQKQAQQIQQLLSMITQYKNKIKNFSKYEEVILKLQNNDNNLSNHLKSQQNLSIYQSFTLNIEPVRKQLKLNIHPNYNLAIHTENISSRNMNSTIRNSLQDTVPSFSKLHNLQQNFCFRNSFNEDKFSKKVPSFYTPLKSVNRLKNGLSDPQKNNKTLNYLTYIEESQPSVIQRVPSLQNIRRIKNCFKLLKN